MEDKNNKTIVIKLGGSIFSKKDTSLDDVVRLQKEGWRLILVHGGANVVTGWLKRLGIESKFVDGERITDEASLEVVTAVLGGLVNKEIVASITTRGGKALGISGVDGSIICGKIRNKKTGYMGDVVSINKEPLETILEGGFIPVISPVSYNAQTNEDALRLLININGDPAAGEIAAAVKAEKLIFLTDVNGIKNKNGEVLSVISQEDAKNLLAEGTANGGMVPKINACLKGLSGGARACIINGTEKHILYNEIAKGGFGTTIKA